MLHHSSDPGPVRRSGRQRPAPGEEPAQNGTLEPAG